MSFVAFDIRRLDVVEGDVAAFLVTEFGHPPEKVGVDRRVPGLNADKSEPRHLRLLRPRRERPRGSRAAKERDERAPHHVWMAPAWQEIIWRAAQRSLAVMCPACWCSPGGLLALMGSANRVLIIRTGSVSR